MDLEELNDPNEPPLVHPTVSLVPLPGKPHTDAITLGAGETAIIERRITLRLVHEFKDKQSPKHLLRQLDDYKPITIRLRVDFLKGEMPTQSRKRSRWMTVALGTVLTGTSVEKIARGISEANQTGAAPTYACRSEVDLAPSRGHGVIVGDPSGLRSRALARR